MGYMMHSPPWNPDCKMSLLNTKWFVFNPPKAPHFGGVPWEREIKSVKAGLELS